MQKRGSVFDFTFLNTIISDCYSRNQVLLLSIKKNQIKFSYRIIIKRALYNNKKTLEVFNLPVGTQKKNVKVSYTSYC